MINSHTLSHQNDCHVTALVDGGFIVTWESHNQDAGVNDNGSFGQGYNANGTLNGGGFQANTEIAANQDNPDISALTDGGFVIVWESFSQDTVDSDGVYGQRFNEDDTRNGIEFLVNSFTANNQQASTVTSLENGGFVVTLQSYNQDDPGNLNRGIYGQLYNADGTRAGSEFQVNSETANNQQNPQVTKLADGGFVITWASYDQDAGGTDDGVFGQLFSIDLFTTGDDTVYLPAIGPSGGWQALGGDDYVIGGDAANTVDGGEGSDWLYGGGGDDTINAGAGAMDVSLGDDGNDTINGEADLDYMYGYAGNDTLRGVAGDDVAYGGTGKDELYGDAGADWLFGEAGNDWMWGGDVICDFEDGSDMLDLSGAGITSFADLTIGTFGQFTTITSASGDIIYLRGAGDVAIAESSITGADFIFSLGIKKGFDRGNDRSQNELIKVSTHSTHQ